ncbi:MAG: hypothetical protein AAF458_13715 [Pseudomonadota bacterium]
MNSAAPALGTADENGVEYRWMTADELARASGEGELIDGPALCDWLHMWQNEVDETGRPVTRSYGVPTTHVEYYKFNRSGSHNGTYRIGDFGTDGLPVPEDAATA